MSPRKILTEAERAERKKRSWDPNQFKKGKPGDEGQWKRGAKALAGTDVDANLKAFCKVLGLNSIPNSLRDLSKARNAAMKQHHPDKEGGSTGFAQKINEAFEELTKHLTSENR